MILSPSRGKKTGNTPVYTEPGSVGSLKECRTPTSIWSGLWCKKGSREGTEKDKGSKGKTKKDSRVKVV